MLLLFLLLMICGVFIITVRWPVSTSSRHRDDDDAGKPRADRRLGSDGRYKRLVRRLRHWKRLATRTNSLTSLEQFERWQLWKVARYSPDVSSSQTNALQQSINVTSTCMPVATNVFDTVFLVTMSVFWHESSNLARRPSTSGLCQSAITFGVRTRG